MCAKEPLLKIFRITALDQVFPIYPDGRGGHLDRRRARRRRSGRVMATVRLSFSPAPVHVRTARLVGVAVARRAGVAEELLDEVRLAIGEACTRAVALHRQYGLPDLVTVEMSDSESYTVRVIDHAPIEASVGLAKLPPDELADESLTDEALTTGVGSPCSPVSSTTCRCARSTTAPAPRSGWSGRSPAADRRRKSRSAQTCGHRGEGCGP